MKKVFVAFLLSLSPIVSADMDDLCFIYIKEFGTNDILKGIERQGCVRNNVLQIVYGMENAPEMVMMFHSGRWCRFDRNMDIKGAVLSCVLYATTPRNRLDKKEKQDTCLNGVAIDEEFLCYFTNHIDLNRREALVAVQRSYNRQQNIMGQHDALLEQSDSARCWLR